MVSPGRVAAPRKTARRNHRGPSTPDEARRLQAAGAVGRLDLRPQLGAEGALGILDETAALVDGRLDLRADASPRARRSSGRRYGCTCTAPSGRAKVSWTTLPVASSTCTCTSTPGVAVTRSPPRSSRSTPSEKSTCDSSHGPCWQVVRHVPSPQSERRRGVIRPLPYPRAHPLSQTHPHRDASRAVRRPRPGARVRPAGRPVGRCDPHARCRRWPAGSWLMRITEISPR